MSISEYPNMSEYIDEYISVNVSMNMNIRIPEYLNLSHEHIRN